MKRLLLALSLVAVMMFPAASFAEELGVYVAPKFTYSFQTMDDVAAKGNGIDYSLSDGDDSTAGVALAVGYDFGVKFDVPVRVELEYAYRGENKESWNTTSGADSLEGSMKVHAQTLFVNAYYDFKNDTAFTPYVGFGIGAAFLDTKNSIDLVYGGNTYDASASNTETNFAWNVGAGVAYELTKSWDIDFGYRFVDMGQAEGGKINGAVHGEADVTAHEFALGLRYTF
jgi:opacity protein-like surface antigen